MSRLICHIHDDIMKLSEKITKDTTSRQIKSMDEETMRDLLDEINSKVSDIFYLAEEAKECGKSMEDRMRKYYDAVVDLGFERVRE